MSKNIKWKILIFSIISMIIINFIFYILCIFSNPGINPINYLTEEIDSNNDKKTYFL